MKILGWITGIYPDCLTKQRVATLSGFSVKGGTFNTYISELKRNGWIEENGNGFVATKDGLQQIAEPPEIPAGVELIEMWAGKFRAGAGKIMKIICNKYPEPITKEDLGFEAGFEPSGGTFNTYLSELRRNNLIEIEGNTIIASKEFFE